MAKTFIDDYKIFVRGMMLVVTILTYQAVHWFMSIPPDDMTTQAASLVSVCMGALTGTFAVFVNAEGKAK
tara:strand:+ start:791 stop:1000 length:210 start_codon:yes stop_codon:yes gene_type:complete